MELKDFIYLYAKQYHSNLVKVTLAVENWNDQDFDKRYLRYIQEYIKCRDILLNKDAENIEIVFRQAKEKRIKDTYEFLFKRAIENIRQDFILSDTDYDNFKNKLRQFEDKENFNFDYLIELRNIEEEFRKKE
ncbi:MAG: hypothetical protein FWH53_11600 [Leptospirales bacterium]|nr:hypothetical protein [Leptospirales bacterium]